LPHDGSELHGLPVSDELAEQRARLHAERQFRSLSELVARERRHHRALVETRSFRYISVLRNLYARLRALRRLPGSPLLAEPTEAIPQDQYQIWVDAFDVVDRVARGQILYRLSRLERAPLVSIVLPVYNAPERFLRAVLTSVRRQLYTNWELCIADDASTKGHVTRVLEQFRRTDPRIKVVRRQDNGHICAATNSALALAEGEWVALIDHDDLLPEHALALSVLALADHPEAGMLYTDEDKVDEGGHRHSPYFKPDFDPLLLLGQNYLAHFLMIRRDLVAAAGGMREGFEGSQDWDLVLRVSELIEPSQVVHVPHVLYHWRSHAGSTSSGIGAKPYAADAGERAVRDHLARTGRPATVSPLTSGHLRITWPLPVDPPLVSVLVPTRDGALLRQCIDSVLSKTSYPRMEVVVVDNGSTDPEILDYLRLRQDELQVIRDDRPFNFAALNNEAVEQAKGEVVCLLNDDTEVIEDRWLDEMVGQLLQPGVGAVGAKLFYDDGRLQHAGVVLGVGGAAGHAYRMVPGDAVGSMGRLILAQTLSAVTGACMVVRREAWEQLGGMDEVHLPVAFNDVDFCLRLREAGWRVVWTPEARLLHHESVTRGDETKRRAGFAAEELYMIHRWGDVLRTDPAYNPNLANVAEEFSLAWPPRVSFR
jgi:GT2 family glycosyltransferase